MQISFKKVNKEGIDFSLHVKELNFFGKLFAEQNSLVLCKGKIKGNISHICDICGSDMVLEIDQDVDIFISDGIYKSNKENEFDVVEFYGGIIDLDEVLNSEIEAIKSDYYYCKECNK